MNQCFSATTVLPIVTTTFQQASMDHNLKLEDNQIVDNLQLTIEERHASKRGKECCGCIMMIIWSAVITIFVIIIITCQHSSPEIKHATFQYVLQPNRSCTENSFDVLIWIHSAPNQQRNRLALRQTWANNLHVKPHGSYSSKLIFFLGVHENDTELQTGLEYESEFYQDIVQENYIDSYHNLTYKAMSALKWIDTNCDPERYKLILKGDDDLLVDNDRLWLILKRHGGLPNETKIHTVICAIYTNGKVARDDSKWSISKEDYSKRVYPPYCAGMAVILTNDLIATMWARTQITKFFWVDDVFLTGLLLERQKVTWTNIDVTYATLHYSHPLRAINSAWANMTYVHMSPMVHDLFYQLWWSRFGNPMSTQY